jgi:predicted dinucleotide-binding enzyme
MKIGVLGTGMVGQAIAGKLAALGHEVKMGAREAGNEKAQAWAKSAGPRASHGTFAEAAAFGDMVFHCALGTAALDVIAAAGAANLAGKVLVDVSNPLDFSQMPPTLFTGPADSLGERIQKAFRQARVVKALNTVNAQVMVAPERLPAETNIFVCGNDADAKKQVAALIQDFGWKCVIDLGDITAARATEAYLLLWLRLWGVLHTADFNIHIVR